MCVDIATIRLDGEACVSVVCRLGPESRAMHSVDNSVRGVLQWTSAERLNGPQKVEPPDLAGVRIRASWHQQSPRRGRSHDGTGAPPDARPASESRVHRISPVTGPELPAGHHAAPHPRQPLGASVQGDEHLPRHRPESLRLRLHPGPRILAQPDRTLFSKMARSVLRQIRDASKEDLWRRIDTYFEDLNAAPLILRWKHGIEDLNVA